jgi:hypothetical protein
MPSSIAPRVAVPNLSDRIDVDKLELVTAAAANSESAAGPPPSQSHVTWSNSSGSVSGGGLVAEYCCAGAFSTTVANQPVARGHHYWEVTLSTGQDRPDTYTNIGVVPAGAAVRELMPSNPLHPDPRNGAWVLSWGQWGRYHNGDIFMFALDADQHVVYFGLNGAWLNGDPEELGGGSTVGDGNAPLVPAAQISASTNRPVGDRWIANFGARAFQYRPPSGYGAYGTGGKGAVAAGSSSGGLASVENEVVVAGRRVPLPEGQWSELARFKDPRGVREVAILGRVRSSRLVELVGIDADNAASYPRNASCDRTDYLAIDVTSNEPSGAQRCWWVNHAVGLWRDQNAFRLARNAARSVASVMPDVMINVSVHEADKSGSVTAHYYFDPAEKGIATPLTSWADSPWQRDHVASDPARKNYVDERIGWGKSWAKILFAYR